MLDGLDLPRLVAARDRDVLLRIATRQDVPAVARLLADDPVSAARGDSGGETDPIVLERAFEAIDADPSNVLVVAELDGAVVAVLQLTLIPGLARSGATRLQVEAVRVRQDLRSEGLGGALMRWVLETAPALGADLVQLTSDGRRTEAHRFYERLGFEASHLGFKLRVPPVGSGAANHPDATDAGLTGGPWT